MFVAPGAVESEIDPDFADLGPAGHPVAFVLEMSLHVADPQVVEAFSLEVSGLEIADLGINLPEVVDLESASHLGAFSPSAIDLETDHLVTAGLMAAVPEVSGLEIADLGINLPEVFDLESAGHLGAFRH